MTKTKRMIFWFLLLGIENLLLISILIGGVYLFAVTRKPQPSDFERQMARLDLTHEDYRARAPYVMFRPRPNRNPKAYRFWSKGVRMNPDYDPFIDFASFCRQLSEAGPEQEPSPARRIWELLSEEGRRAIESGVGSDNEDVRIDVSTRLDSLIARRDLHSGEHFDQLELSEGYRRLLSLPREDLHEWELLRLNRQLIARAFPRTIRPANAMNSHGFFSPELPDEKRENEFRIAMVGGSVAWGGGSHDTTPVGQLALQLKERIPALRDRPITWINGALPSGVSGQELAQFIYHILPLEIDLLVAFDGFNDFYCPLNGYDVRQGYPPDYIVEEYRYYEFIGDRTWESTLLSLFDPTLMQASPEYTVNTYYQELGIRRPAPERIEAHLVPQYMANVHKMVRIANGYGIKAAVFLQPFSPKHNPVERAECRKLRELYAEAHERLAEAARLNGTQRVYRDLNYTGEELRELFRDVAHVQQMPGNAIFARHMIDAMVEAQMFKE